jgi:hypothetical protein
MREKCSCSRCYQTEEVYYYYYYYYYYYCRLLLHWLQKANAAAVVMKLLLAVLQDLADLRTTPSREEGLFGFFTYSIKGLLPTIK